MGNKYVIAVIGGGVAILALLATFAERLLGSHSSGDWPGIGAFVVFGIFLLVLGLILVSIIIGTWVIMRSIRRKKAEAKVIVIVPAPTTPTPPPAYPAVSAKKKKHGFWHWIVAALVVSAIIGGVCVADILLKHWATGEPISLPWSRQTLNPPQPQGRCDGAFALDDAGKYNFSDSTEDSVRVEPGSTTELCYGSKVSIPGDRWKTWGAQFVRPPGQKDVCVAYFGYMYPDGSVRVIGPMYGPKLELSNMSGVWRIATNCPIEYYRW